jgi:membrane protein
MLLFGATTVFAQMQVSLNQIWGVAARPSRSGIAVFVTTRLLSLGLVLIIGFLLLTSLVLSMSVVALIRYAEYWIPIPSFAIAAIDLTVSLGIATVLFATIFKVLPDVELEWRDMWESGFLTAVLFVLGQYMISLYLTTTAPASAYGAAGSLVLVLFWVYYSSLIVFFGAAFTRVRMGHRQRGVVPKKTAAKVVIEVLEETENGRRHKVETAE